MAAGLYLGLYLYHQELGTFAFDFFTRDTSNNSMSKHAMFFSSKISTILSLFPIDSGRENFYKSVNTNDFSTLF